MNIQPVQDLDSIIGTIGEAGKRLSEIEAAEGAAGNISVCIPGPLDASGRFPQAEEIALPMNVPGLAGASFLVTGSGRRLREIPDDPEGNLGYLVIQPDGKTGRLFTSARRRFGRLTSEFNSHLAVHHDRLLRGDVSIHAVIHAQPPHLTYLSHIAAYQEESFLNRHLLRWQPETIIQMPDGIGAVPFIVPGSAELLEATRRALQDHQLAIWSRHGAITRADRSVRHACDLIEYAEAAAHYEYLNLVAGEPSEGLSAEQLRAICLSVGVRQTIF